MQSVINHDGKTAANVQDAGFRLNGADYAGAGAGFQKAGTSDGEELFDTYFTERGIPLAKAKLAAELLTPAQTARLTHFRVWSIKFRYWNPDSSCIEDFFRLRYLQVRDKKAVENGWPDHRYWQAKGSGSP